MTTLVRFDWAIKHLLRNKANFDVLEGFLSELLGNVIKIEQILELESNKDSANDKFNRVDLIAITSEQQRVLIEVQCNSEADYLSRMLYASSKAICQYLDAGDQYFKVPKVISVSIVFFNMGEGKDYLYRGTTSFKGRHYQDTLKLNEREHELYANLIPADRQTPEQIYPEYHIIKVPAFSERIRDKLDEWVYFLKNGKIEADFNARGIQSAAKKLDVLGLNAADRRAYEAYQDLLHSDTSFVAEQKLDIIMAKKEGLQEGKEIGQKENSMKIAAKMLLEGVPLEFIAKVTELSIEQIEKLQKKPS